MDNNKINEISELFNEFNDYTKKLYNTTSDNAFILSSFLLSLDEIPYVKGISEEDNNKILEFFNIFKDFTYTKEEMRRAFMYSYLKSLEEIENYKINVSLEIIQLFLASITKEIYNSLCYTEMNVLNPYGNSTSLSNLLSLMGIPEEHLNVVVKDEKELSLGQTLKRLTNENYDISTALPALSYRCDIIVSDPYLESATDILMFFADYVEYLNQEGFMVLNLPIGFIRTRVFSDLLEQYNLTLVMLVNGPYDLAEGIMKSSIVVLRKSNNKDAFMQADMLGVKEISDNLEVLELVKKEIKKYILGEEENENNGN